MPREHRYIVDVHVQFAIKPGADETEELKHGDAVNRALSWLYPIRGLKVVRVEATER